MFEIRKLGGDLMAFVCDRPVGWATNIVHYDAPDNWPADLPFLNGRGFHTPMENGLILSTQFGRGNYCNSRYHGLFAPTDREFEETSPDAEVAAWWAIDPHDEMLEWPNDDVVYGYFRATWWWELVDALSYVPLGQSIKPVVAALLRKVS